MGDKYTSLYQQVVEYLRRGQIEKIDMVIRQTFRTRPDDPVPLCVAGMAMVRGGYTEPGFDALLEALVRFPKHYFVYFALGDAHDHRENERKHWPVFAAAWNCDTILDPHFSARPGSSSIRRIEKVRSIIKPGSSNISPTTTRFAAISLSLLANSMEESAAFKSWNPF